MSKSTQIKEFSNQMVESMEETYYGSRWAREDALVLHTLRLHRVAAILNEFALEDLKTPSILEVGCGTGLLSHILSFIGPVTAIELSSTAIESARKNYPAVNFVAGDFLKSDFHDVKFDVVVAQEVIEHVDDQSGFMEHCRSLLKPHGLLILTTPNAWTFKYSGLWDEYDRAGLLQPREDILSRNKLKLLAKDCFEVKRLYTICRTGTRGILRLLNSPKVQQIPLIGKLTSLAPVGLHLVMIGRAKERCG